MKKAFFITSFIIFTLAPAISYAGQYKLVRGSQFELCREYEKNLNSFRGEPPMVCERKINPRFTDFSKPEWKKMDSKKHSDLIENIVRYRNRNKPKEVQDKKWDKVRLRIERGEVHIWQEKFDVDHDGKKETIVKLDAYGCDPHDEADFGWPTTFAIAVVDIKNKIMDNQYKYRVLHPIAFDVFFYKERTYLSKWRGLLGFKGGHINVYEPFNVRSQMGIQNDPVCQYSYID